MIVEATDENALRAELRAVSEQLAAQEQPVNQQVTFGNQVFHVASDSDIEEMIKSYKADPSRGLPIGPCHRKTE